MYYLRERPSERTPGGGAFAKAWNAAWKGHVTVISSVARFTPSGTTGRVTARIELAKPGYKIPFRMICLFTPHMSVKAGS